MSSTDDADWACGNSETQRATRHQRAALVAEIQAALPELRQELERDCDVIVRFEAFVSWAHNWVRGLEES